MGRARVSGRIAAKACPVTTAALFAMFAAILQEESFRSGF
jgi:hypothetical protein